LAEEFQHVVSIKGDRSMKVAASTTALFVAILASPAFSQETSREDFQRYGNMMVGRWIGDVTLVADLPGFGKKGDKLIVHLSIRWISDRNGLEGEAFAGPGTGRSFLFWDPAAKRIKEYRIDSGGTTTSIEIRREDGKWLWRSCGHLRDETPFEAQGEILVSEDAKTFTYVGKGTMGGRPTVPLNDVFRKVSD